MLALERSQMPDPDLQPAAPVVAPYGTWTSPLTARTVAAGALRLGSIAIDGDDIYWIEGRPDEGGRHVIVKRSADGRIADATPERTNVRTRVHEYGGAAYVVSRGVVYYSEFADQRLYRLVPGLSPEPITPPGEWYYADGSVDVSRDRLVCVREDHTVKGREAVTSLVSVPLDGPVTPGRVVASGHDFYSTPRFSPDGSRLCWLAWRHPHMPWDSTELWVAEVEENGEIVRPAHVAGGEHESIFQPEWSPDGTLYFVSDRTGWWNLYAERREKVVPVLEIDAEIGVPQWLFGYSRYAFLSNRRAACVYDKNGMEHLAIIDLHSNQREILPVPYTVFGSITSDGDDTLFVAAASPAKAAEVAALEVRGGKVRVLKRSLNVEIDPDYFSQPQPIEFPTSGGLKAYALFYPPRNKEFVAPEAERPPLLVISHGGPTSATTSALRLAVHYWTTRGIAVVDVNYGGSSGYGRSYR